ncbi:hypothetical protein [Nonomuraea jiangxiensis]|uniref:hypothetical protein n=1 Tax=Nonomuraea jiangxiensis TaxID=633440 RepID=UPI000B8102D7|nr:hypothetical protein [Nonomuraea jiangxiensis]
MTSFGNRSTPLARRVTAAALVGLALPLLTWVIAQAGLAFVPYTTSGYGWGRFGEGMVLFAGTVLFLLMASWPALWMLRVRPAWHVALPAPIAAVILWLLLDGVISRLIPNVLAVICVITTLAYGLTALLTTPGQPWWWWQQVPLMAVGGPPPTAPAPAAAPRPRLSELGIPLIAPHLPGYTIDHLATRSGGLRYVLRPSAPDPAADPAERDASAIAAIVRSRVEPPGEDSEYERTGPRTWRRATDTGTVYVIDRDDATITLRAGPRVPAEDVLQATTTLAPRPPTHFPAP